MTNDDPGARSLRDAGGRYDARHLGRLAEADLFFLFGALLAPPRAVPEAHALPSEADVDELAERAGLGTAPFARDLRDALRARAALDAEALAAEHARLFDGRQPCPPNETAYIRRDKGRIIADIRGFYEAFGVSPAGTSGEKPDHVSTELEFVALLLVMLEEAERSGDAAAEQVTRDALRAFAGDHLGEWLPLFCERLEQTGGAGALGRLGPLLSAAWSAAVARHDLPIAPPGGAWPQADPGTPYECGMAGDDGTNRA